MVFFKNIRLCYMFCKKVMIELRSVFRTEKKKFDDFRITYSVSPIVLQVTSRSARESDRDSGVPLNQSRIKGHTDNTSPCR